MAISARTPETPVAGGTLVSVDPRDGSEHGSVPTSSKNDVDTACTAAGELFRALPLFPPVAGTPPHQVLLHAIADVLSEHGDTVIATADAESALGAGRLAGELARTAFQLHAHADLVDTPLLRRPLKDPADPERVPPLSGQDRIDVAIGPVAVFAASNFPLAFGVLGGDTASALAAGCPVIVKAHPAHPRTGRLLAEVVAEAVRRAHVNPAWLQVVHGDGTDIGSWLTLHPDIAAVGFTGSTGGGLALKRLADSRPTPIPVYAEMGSVNPTFIGPHAATTRAQDIGTSWAAVLSANAGQLCTKPGILVAPSEAADKISAAALTALEDLNTPPMLAPRLAESFTRQVREIQAVPAATVRTIPPRSPAGAHVPAVVITAAVDALTSYPELADEVFGPAGLVLSSDQPVDFAEGMSGALTATVIADREDAGWVAALLPVLARKAGRVVYDKWPTGVSVGLATVHGGPFPATSAPATTSVGLTAAWRFLRPVCFDSFPYDILPRNVRWLTDDTAET